MQTLRENLGLYVVLILGLNVVLSVAQALTPVPDDLLSGTARDYWEGVLRAAIEGTSSGLLSCVTVVAAAAGVEVRAARRARTEEQE